MHPISSSRIIHITLSLGMMCIASTSYAASTFLDVPSSQENAFDIEHLAENNIVGGYEDGTFRPEKMINRAEFTKIVVGAVYKNEEATLKFLKSTCDSRTTSTFKDVENGAWYSSYICIATMTDTPLITGYRDGTFKPNAMITFAEAATILGRAFFKTQVSTDAEWYKQGVLSLVGAGAIPQEILSLQMPLTRGAMATMISRIIRKDSSKKAISLDTIANWLSLESYASNNPKMSFIYPSSWGNITQLPLPDADPSRRQIYGFSALEQDEYATGIYIDLLSYNETNERTYEECPLPCMPGDENVTVDLVAQRDLVEKSGKFRLGAFRASVQNGYSAAGGNLFYIYTFFTPSHRVTVTALYDLFEIYNDIPHGSSITEMLEKDLGSSQITAMNTSRLMQLYPNASLRAFLQNMESFVRTLHVDA